MYADIAVKIEKLLLKNARLFSNLTSCRHYHPGRPRMASIKNQKEAFAL